MTNFDALIGALTPLCRTLLTAGVGLLVQSTLLLLLGLLAGAALHRRGCPAAAVFVYRAALVGIAAGALLSLVFADRFRPVWSITLPSASPPPEMILAPVPGLAERVVHLNAASVSGIGQLYVAAAAAWAGGALLLLAWLCLCQRHILRLRNRSVPISDDTSAILLRLCLALKVRLPHLLMSADVPTPFLAGLRHPAIFLPASYRADFNDQEMRAILIHELTHLRRSDCAWNLLAKLLCAVFWTQPLLWLLCRRLEQASEEVCDQEVVARSGSAAGPLVYAHCLLRLAERRGGAVLGMGAAAVLFRSSLGRRVEWILRVSRRPAAPDLSSWFRGTAAGGAVCAVLGSLFLVSAAATPFEHQPVFVERKDVVVYRWDAPSGKESLPETRRFVRIHTSARATEPLHGLRDGGAVSLREVRVVQQRLKAPAKDRLFVLPAARKFSIRRQVLPRLSSEPLYLEGHSQDTR